jgi:hypothetical protein
MTRSAPLPRAVFKEFRALSLPWYVCGFVMIVPALLLGSRYFRGIEVIAYIVGAPVIGALSIGHEHRPHAGHLSPSRAANECSS